MATNNAINSNIPIEVAKGGTAATSLLDHGVLVGSGTSPITALTVGATGELLVGVSSSDPAFGTSAYSDFTFTSATANVTRTLTVSNSDNTAASTSSALINIAVGGRQVKDPITQFTITSVTDWSTGIDNSQGDWYKISTASTLGTPNDALIMRTTGERNLPLTPAFCAYNSTFRSSVSSPYTIIFNTEIFDIGSNYDASTGIFSAPIDGHYVFSTYVSTNATANSATIRLAINSDTSLGVLSTQDPSQMAPSNGEFCMGISALLELDASDTVEVAMLNPVDVNNGTVQTFFSGYLAN